MFTVKLAGAVECSRAFLPFRRISRLRDVRVRYYFGDHDQMTPVVSDPRDGHCPECGMVEHRPGCHEATIQRFDECSANQLVAEISAQTEKSYHLGHKHFIALVARSFVVPAVRHWRRIGIVGLRTAVVVHTAVGPVEVRAVPDASMQQPVIVVPLADCDGPS